MLEFLNHFFAVLCGQSPDHTWAPGGSLLPCCQRCTGLYVGAAVAVLLHWWLKPRLTARFLEMHGVFLLVMAPFGFHWMPQGPVLRTVTGVLFGFAVTTFLRAPLERRTGPGSGARAVLRDDGSHGTALSAYLTGLAATLLVLPVAAALGGDLMAALLSGAAFCGALALGVLALASTAVGLAAASRLFRRPSITRAGLKAADRIVAQVSKPAVSRVSQPADASDGPVSSMFRQPADLEVGDTAGSETCATTQLAKFVSGPGVSP